MSVLNNIGKLLGEAAEATANKAKKIAEITKLNSYISTEEKEIEKGYLEIGKLVYEQSKGEAVGYFGELCNKITESTEKIEEFKGKLEEVKNSK